MTTLDKNIAISIEYSPEENTAPKVTAKGYGYMAEEIIQIAKEHNIPIKQDQALTELLAQVEIDEEIPQVLYEAVAQILVFAYQLSGKTDNFE
jgi:flagellar biosynthesis protein